MTDDGLGSTRSLTALAVDFDKTGWEADAVAFVGGCRRLGLTAALERSRSGRGGHVWLFFEQAIPAALARRLGSHLLTEAMENRPDIGLDSYDRLFPNQDTLPQGGFGNLIALPLQRASRDQGNSVFVDDDLVPWTDQWAFLASVRRIGRPEVESIVQDAERRGRVLGVRLPPQEDGDEECRTRPQPLDVDRGFQRARERGSAHQSSTASNPRDSVTGSKLAR